MSHSIQLAQYEGDKERERERKDVCVCECVREGKKEREWDRNEIYNQNKNTLEGYSPTSEGGSIVPVRVAA